MVKIAVIAGLTAGSPQAVVNGLSVASTKEYVSIELSRLEAILRRDMPPQEYRQRAERVDTELAVLKHRLQALEQRAKSAHYDEKRWPNE